MEKKIVGFLARFLRGKTEEDKKVFAAVFSLVLAVLLTALFFGIWIFLPGEIAIMVLSWGAVALVITALTFTIYVIIKPHIQRIGVEIGVEDDNQQEVS